MENLRKQAKRDIEIKRLLELLKPSYASSREILAKEGYRSIGMGGKWSNGIHDFEIIFWSDSDTVEIL